LEQKTIIIQILIQGVRKTIFSFQQNPIDPYCSIFALEVQANFLFEECGFFRAPCKNKKKYQKTILIESKKNSSQLKFLIRARKKFCSKTSAVFSLM
jgi:hypothetical protein